MNESPPHRRTMDLTIGRVSIPGAKYFITICVQERKPVLTDSERLPKLSMVTRDILSGSDASLLCVCIMPDHIHVLFQLGHRLTLDRLMAKYKVMVGKLLPTEAAWQRNFFEHRLRPDETAGSYALYIFMNPYRAGLIQPSETWSGWISGQQFEFDFMQLLKDGKYPPAEWMSDAIHSKLPSPEFTGNHLP